MYMYIHTHVYIHTYTHTYIHICIYMYIYISYIYTYMYTYTGYICMCVCIYIYIHIYTGYNIYIYTHTHTHTHIHIHAYIHTQGHDTDTNEVGAPQEMMSRGGMRPSKANFSLGDIDQVHGALSAVSTVAGPCGPSAASLLSGSVSAGQRLYEGAGGEGLHASVSSGAKAGLPRMPPHIDLMPDMGSVSGPLAAHVRVSGGGQRAGWWGGEDKP